MVKKLLCVAMLLMVSTLPVMADDMPEQGKVIYLTFDDGPGCYTAQLLDILKRHDTKATFFLVNTGTNMEELLQRMVSEGHSVGIHSYSHDFKTIYANDEAFMDDIYSMQRTIFEKCGIITNLMRFPGGGSNTISRRYCDGIMSRLTQRVLQEGFQYFDWNVDSGDAYGCPDPEQIFQRVIAGIRGRDQAVVLQHDVNGCSVKTVERIILWGKRNGYTFQPLTEQSPACRHKVQN